MCGIIGYVGSRQAAPILLAALEKLEYRGYDSAGLAVVLDGQLVVRKTAGRIQALADLLKKRPLKGTTGIGHTRWATHGAPSTVNAHPHRDCSGKIAIVHNGIIENYQALKARLIAEGHNFLSQTDTEVAAHLVESHYKGDLVEAVRLCTEELEGAFALAVVSTEQPGLLVAARRFSPLVVASTASEGFIASDIQAVLEYTKDVDILNEGEFAAVQAGKTLLFDHNGCRIERKPYHVPWDAEQVEKAGFPHFMLKEIHEQPVALRRSLEERLSSRSDKVLLAELAPFKQMLKKVNRIIITACGTAFYASLVGKFLIENWARVPVEVDLASEWRYRNPILSENTLTMVVTQSGETADTLAALRKAKAEGAPVFSVVNAVGSSAAREADAPLYIKAGPEIGVASTKAYTGQVITLALFAIYLARLRGTMTKSEEAQLVEQIRAIPSLAEHILAETSNVAALAEKYHDRQNFIFLGRGANMSTAYEGALKLKEISYIHAEGYAAGEMKHGPIALVCPECPTVAVAVRGDVYEKMLSNIEEVRARGGEVIAVACEGDTQIDKHVNAVIRIPACHEFLSPLLAVIPLQLFAYYVGVRRGCDVDKPRNLAKSVTVE
jgi:glucosamine--fructose-6-phosphate aminotransferase (isomerizing)